MPSLGQFLIRSHYHFSPHRAYSHCRNQYFTQHIRGFLTTARLPSSSSLCFLNHNHNNFSKTFTTPNSTRFFSTNNTRPTDPKLPTTTLTRRQKPPALRKRNLAPRTPGFDHLLFKRLVHPNNEKVIHVVGIRIASPADVQKACQEIDFCLREAKPDTVVLQYCEDRYKLSINEPGDEPMELNLSSIFDPRHFSNSVRMCVLLINRLTSGPKFNPFMYGIIRAREQGTRIVLGDVPYSVFNYRNDTGRQWKEAWNYFNSTTRKERKLGDFPGATRLIMGFEPVENIYNWLDMNKKKVIALERQVYSQAEKFNLEKGIGASYTEDTVKSMAHACFHAEGKTILCITTPLAMEGIEENFGKTTKEQITALRRKPEKSVQNLKVINSWVFSKWNAYCMLMFGMSYVVYGYDPQMALTWLLTMPVLYPTFWCLISFRGRSRIMKFQKLLEKNGVLGKPLEQYQTLKTAATHT